MIDDLVLHKSVALVENSRDRLDKRIQHLLDDAMSARHARQSCIAQMVQMDTDFRLASKGQRD